MAETEEYQRESMGGLEQFILGLAHELNNPNTYIRMNAVNLKKLIWLLRPCLDEYAEAHPQAKFGPYTLSTLRSKISQQIEGILDATVRIITIADKLKESTVESLTAGSDIGLDEVVKDMVEAHRFMWGRSIALDIHLEPEHNYAVQGHRMQLEQAVAIVVTNAIDAIVERFGDQEDGKGHLEISLRDKHNRITITIKDNGCGMSRETLARIFDPYFTTKPTGKGDGLGLSICRSIISRHGGKIEVGSEPGRGSTVTLEIPR